MRFAVLPSRSILRMRTFHESCNSLHQDEEQSDTDPRIDLDTFGYLEEIRETHNLYIVYLIILPVGKPFSVKNFLFFTF